MSDSRRGWRREARTRSTVRLWAGDFQDLDFLEAMGVHAVPHALPDLEQDPGDGGYPRYRRTTSQPIATPVMGARHPIISGR